MLCLVTLTNMHVLSRVDAKNHAVIRLVNVADPRAIQAAVLLHVHNFDNIPKIRISDQNYFNYLKIGLFNNLRHERTTCIQCLLSILKIIQPNKQIKLCFHYYGKLKRYLYRMTCKLNFSKKTIRPILLYGSEIWGHGNVEMLERIQLKFYKYTEST